MARKPRRRKVRNYLLDTSLQLHYVLVVTVLSALIAGALGLIIWTQQHRASEKATVTIGNNASDLGMEPSYLIADMAGRDTGVARLMIVTGVGLMIALTLYLIVMTHKVAGPLFKIGTYLDKMAAGRLGPVYPLRKGDMLLDFYDHFRGAHDAVRARLQADNAAVGRLLAACDVAGVEPSGPLGHALDELRRHHRERDESLS